MKSIVVLLMLASIAAAYETPSLVLEKMFVNLGTFNCSVNDVNTTKTYYVSRDIKLEWAHSLMFCRSFGMDLVSLPTEKEANVFLRYCANNNFHFNEFTHIGGSYIGSSLNNWYWINDGLPVNYHLRMLSGEPNNAGGRQNCLAVQKQPDSFVFNDIEGYRVYQEKFVCELIVENQYNY